MSNTLDVPLHRLHLRFTSTPKSESEDEYESEDDMANPYPLEGKYIDEADREQYVPAVHRILGVTHLYILQTHATSRDRTREYIVPTSG